MKIKKILKWAVNLILIAICLWFLILFIYSIYYKVGGLYKNDYLLKTKNKIVFLVTNDIMDPIVHKDNIAVVEKFSKKEKPQEGDIVYILESHSEKLARIERIVDDNGQTKYITKGIKNIYYNPENITINNVKGKLSKTISNSFIIISAKIAISKVFSIISSVLIFLMIIIVIKNKKRSIKREEKRLKMRNKKEVPSKS